MKNEFWTRLFHRRRKRNGVAHITFNTVTFVALATNH